MRQSPSISLESAIEQLGHFIPDSQSDTLTLYTSALESLVMKSGYDAGSALLGLLSVYVAGRNSELIALQPKPSPARRLARSWRRLLTSLKSRLSSLMP